jgi:uncharacterized protein (TIGR03067 family)
VKLQWILLFSLALSLTLPGCKPSEKSLAEKATNDADLKALEGKWKVSFREGTQGEDEEADTAPADPSFYYVIENGVLRDEFKNKDGSVEVGNRRKLTIHADKSPKTVDLVYVDEKGAEIKEKKVKRGITGKKKTSTAAIKDVGIYKIEGDKLELCISWDEKSRPTDFSAPAKSSRYLMKLERIKDGAEVKATDKPADAKDKPADAKDKPAADEKGKDDAKEKPKS